ncbi:MAG: DegQ family serine endoprotease [Parvibaculum sp.]|jgi:serine protease Do|uniref:DegQ family serine endoprotease n=1 Tax=Parvibaculum sp. TaxID=2024848 RepID=UPI000CADA764|nr:DegQ family serine endoprotease [Parvibaculum sp.]MDZ4380500.1 DegQ family serine endoprotease [Parvibaculum sp.]PKP77173.1 MAG: HtrA protease/chaperone protein [Alphaproteobacteria bacterium HGW-Alphaproteobacteria-3]
MRNGRDTTLRPTLRLTALAFATAGALALAAPVTGAFAETAPLDTRSAAPAANALERLPSFADLVEKVNPAVVSIRVDEEVSATAPAGPEMPFPPGSPFEKFFRDLQPQGPNGKPRSRHATALGSGFLISADGYIVTNNHVVGDGKDITVIRDDGSEMKAELIGKDAKTDLALVKVESKKPLPYVVFGDSENVRVGDWVLAVGNPFGLGGTVTTGIVSARGREIGAGPYDDFIQIDASINKGNSGGPTFDVHGNVVGVNTAIFSPTGGSVGIGFAIPSSIAKSVVAQLKDKGTVTRGWLGVTIQQVDDEVASSLSLDKPRGALVAQVGEGSPAEKAGVRTGDVILDVNGKKMEDVRAVSRTVADLEPESNAKLVVWRDGREKAIAVRIGVFPENPQMASASEPGAEPEAVTTESLGLALADSPDGVVVKTVDPASDAAEKGIQPGDIVVKVSGRDVKKPADVVSGVEEASKAKKSSVLLLLRSENRQRFVALSLQKS